MEKILDNSIRIIYDTSVYGYLINFGINYSYPLVKIQHDTMHLLEHIYCRYIMKDLNDDDAHGVTSASLMYIFSKNVESLMPFLKYMFDRDRLRSSFEHEVIEKELQIIKDEDYYRKLNFYPIEVFSSKIYNEDPVDINYVDLEMAKFYLKKVIENIKGEDIVIVTSDIETYHLLVNSFLSKIKFKNGYTISKNVVPKTSSIMKKRSKCLVDFLIMDVTFLEYYDQLNLFIAINNSLHITCEFFMCENKIYIILYIEKKYIGNLLKIENCLTMWKLANREEEPEKIKNNNLNLMGSYYINKKYSITYLMDYKADVFKGLEILVSILRMGKFIIITDTETDFVSTEKNMFDLVDLIYNNKSLDLSFKKDSISLKYDSKNFKKFYKLIFEYYKYPFSEIQCDSDKIILNIKNKNKEEYELKPGLYDVRSPFKFFIIMIEMNKTRMLKNKFLTEVKKIQDFYRESGVTYSVISFEHWENYSMMVMSSINPEKIVHFGDYVIIRSIEEEPFIDIRNLPKKIIKKEE